jgi:hypothetical protein
VHSFGRVSRTDGWITAIIGLPLGFPGVQYVLASYCQLLQPAGCIMPSPASTMYNQGSHSVCVVQCSAVCSAIQCNAVQCSAMQCNAVQCSAVQCSAVQFSAEQCSAVQCSAVQCSAVQCSAVQCQIRPSPSTSIWQWPLDSSPELAKAQ